MKKLFALFCLFIYGQCLFGQEGDMPIKYLRVNVPDGWVITVKDSTAILVPRDSLGIDSTDEIQQISYFDIVADQLGVNISKSGVPSSSVDLTPYKQVFVYDFDSLKIGPSNGIPYSLVHLPLSYHVTAQEGKAYSIVDKILVPGAGINFAYTAGGLVTDNHAITISAKDQSPTNELQALTLDSNANRVYTLTLSNGNSVTWKDSVGAGGGADGVVTSGTHNQVTRKLDFVASPPASNFSVDISALPTDLNDLTDVGTVTYTNRHVLVADGSNYDSRALTEADISDLKSYLLTEVDGSVINEIQTIDTFRLVGTTLEGSLSGDGQAKRTVDLSSLAGGSGIDTLVNYDALRAYAGTSNVVYVQDFTVNFSGRDYQTKGGFFVKGGSGENGATLISGWQRVFDGVNFYPDWFEMNGYDETGTDNGILQDNDRTNGAIVLCNAAGGGVVKESPGLKLFGVGGNLSGVRYGVLMLDSVQLDMNGAVYKLKDAIIDGTFSIGMIYVVGRNKIAIRNGFIHGNALNQTFTTYEQNGKVQGIRMTASQADQCQDVVIENMQIDYVLGNPINLYASSTVYANDYQDFTVRNIRCFHYGEGPQFLNVNNLLVDQVYLDPDTPAVGDHFELVRCDGWTISNGRVIGGSGGGSGIDLYGCRNGTVQNWHITNTKDVIEIHKDSYSNYCANIFINNLRGESRLISTSVGITFNNGQRGTRNIHFKGLYLKDWYQGLSFSGADSIPGPIIIEDFVIDSMTNSGINIAHVKDLRLINGEIKGCGNRGIFWNTYQDQTAETGKTSLKIDNVHIHNNGLFGISLDLQNPAKTYWCDVDIHANVENNGSIPDIQIARALTDTHQINVVNVNSIYEPTSASTSVWGNTDFFPFTTLDQMSGGDWQKIRVHGKSGGLTVQANAGNNRLVLLDSVSSMTLQADEWMDFQFNPDSVKWYETDRKNKTEIVNVNAKFTPSLVWPLLVNQRVPYWNGTTFTDDADFTYKNDELGFKRAYIRDSLNFGDDGITNRCIIRYSGNYLFYQSLVSNAGHLFRDHLNQTIMQLDNSNRGAQFFGPVSIRSALRDGSLSAGTSGQILRSTGTGVQWVTGVLTDDQNIQGGSFNTSNGQLTVGIESGSSQMIPLDGRYLVSEVDGSVTNEGALTVTAGTSTTSVINSNTSGSTPVTLTAGANMTITESGNNITFSSTGGGGGITGSGTANQITFWNGATSVAGDPDLTFNGTQLDAADLSSRNGLDFGDGTLRGYIRRSGNDLNYRASISSGWQIFRDHNNAILFHLENSSGDARVYNDLGIGINPVYKLDASGGDVRFSGHLGLDGKNPNGSYSIYAGGNAIFEGTGNSYSYIKNDGYIQYRKSGQYSEHYIDGSNFMFKHLGANTMMLESDQDVRIYDDLYVDGRLSVNTTPTGWPFRLVSEGSTWTSSAVYMTTSLGTKLFELRDDGALEGSVKEWVSPLIKGLVPDVRAYGDFIRDPLENNAFAGATNKYTVTASGTHNSNYYQWFNNAMVLNGCNVLALDTAVINVNLTAKGAFSANGMTYTQGRVYIVAYTGHDISANTWGRYKDRDGIWNNLTYNGKIYDSDHFPGVQGSFDLYTFTIPSDNYLTEFEFNIVNDNAFDLRLLSLMWFPERPEGQAEGSGMTKYADQNLTEALIFRDASYNNDLTIDGGATDVITASGSVRFNNLVRDADGDGGNVNQILGKSRTDVNKMDYRDFHDYNTLCKLYNTASSVNLNQVAWTDITDLDTKDFEYGDSTFFDLVAGDLRVYSQGVINLKAVLQLTSLGTARVDIAFFEDGNQVGKTYTVNFDGAMTQTITMDETLKLNAFDDVDIRARRRGADTGSVTITATNSAYLQAELIKRGH